ncbi:MAG: glycine--tRNA ligase subunit beta [Burkholderiaceae bacterium]|jgi:glycyl-tRNA synthetase beta chain|nr:glycine--tRNA ligase subunit beta [Burkholderiaceae bacterium]
MKPLLVELCTEELPPRALSLLSESFANAISDSLKQAGFLGDNAQTTLFATPRRLAVLISHVAPNSPDKPIRVKILPVSVALDAEGNPTPPLEKKLASLGFSGITLSDMEKAMDGKTESFFYCYTAPGTSLADGLQAALAAAVTSMPIPKMMSYQRPDGETVQFVRPVHRLLALYGSDIVPVAILGLSAGRMTQGHRFLSRDDIVIPSADTYEITLETEGKVIASFPARKDRIRAILHDKAQRDRVLMPESLLEEVTALVEWPTVYECHFDPVFLDVPQECLILTMQTNQKYFALTDANGHLCSRFLMVSNMETSDPQRIISGNERVIRPRLSDARFFFEQDKKKRLEERLAGLSQVVYHNKLGSLAQRMARVRILAVAIAEMLHADIPLVERATMLAKADLLTGMVGEFPELQGIMGTYYARHDGEPEEVALTAMEHYLPRFAGDVLPSSQTGTIVALADKLEALTGIWGIGLQPTGDRDPFALRRHTLGILRILIEKKLPLSLRALLNKAVGILAINASFQDPTSGLIPFIMDRLRGLLRDRGYKPDEIDSVLSQHPDRLDDLIERLDAVREFATLPEAASLTAANKRITNILKKSSIRAGSVQHALLREETEKQLYAAISHIKPSADILLTQGNYAETLKVLARLRDEVDAFFTHVLVMSEDNQLRNNRIALLTELHGMMNRVADISRLAS